MTSPPPSARFQIDALLFTSKVIGFVGRLAPEKSPGLFLSVAKHLSRLLPSAVFVMVGDGPLRPALKAMTDRMGIARWAKVI